MQGGTGFGGKQRAAMVAALMAVSPFAMTITATPSLAQTDAARPFDIPAQPLQDALVLFNRQSGIQVTAEGGLTAGRASTAVKGTFSSAQALGTLLAGTGLAWRWLDSRTVVLEPAPKVADGAVRLGPVRVEGASGPAQGGQQWASDRSATEGTGSYASSRTSMAKGQDLREIPQSVSIITRQQIEDQALTDIDDVMRQMPGVMVSSDAFVSAGGRYYTRGLPITNVQVDGVMDSVIESASFGGGNNILDLAMYDHVELLRGPDGLYSGSGDSGGTINMARKRPLDHFQARLTASAGSWNNYYAEVDLTSPLALDGAIRGRVVGAFQDREDFYDHAESTNRFVYGIIEADLTESTLLSFGGSYSKSSGYPESTAGFPTFSNGDFIDVPRKTSWGTEWSTFESRKSNWFVRLDHDFSKNWKVSGSYNRTDRDDFFLQGQPTWPVLDGTSYPQILSAIHQETDTRNESFNIHVEGRGDIGVIGYEVLVGFDRRTRSFSYNYFDSADFLSADDGYNIHDLDIWNWYPAGWPEWSYVDSGGNRRREQGFYTRIKLSLNGNMHLVAGGRLTNYKNRTANWSESGIFTPYAGIIYDFDKDWSIYGSISKIYTSQANRLKAPIDNPTPIDPLQGRNYEIGIKGALDNGRITAAFALYRTERVGQSARDPEFSGRPNLPSGCCYLNAGEVVSQGLDVEMNGEVLRNLQVSASYTYNDNEDKTSGRPYNTTSAPEHLFKVWGKYQFEGVLSRLSAGGGFYATSSVHAEGVNGDFVGGGAFRIKRASYEIAELFTEYKLSRNLTATLNIKNLFNKNYYVSIDEPTFGTFFGPPRSFSMTLRGTF